MKTTIFNIQGHRGARGLYPENTITGFLEAVKLGVNTLEMDVVISNDSKVVVSHEAWMNADFCLSPEGETLPESSKKKYNLYEMPYSSIIRFDCGVKVNQLFPQQKSIPAHKPLLLEVITEVEAYVKSQKLPLIHYNIEIKTEVGSQLYNPPPTEFTKLVYEEIIDLKVKDRVTIQSFDKEILRAMHKRDKLLSIGLLIEDKIALESDIHSLGFLPEFYSPEFTLVTESLVSEVHDRGLQIIPWTVNETHEMRYLIDIGVDGIITDYPNRLLALIKKIRSDY